MCVDCDNATNGFADPYTLRRNCCKVYVTHGYVARSFRSVMQHETVKKLRLMLLWLIMSKMH